MSCQYSTLFLILFFCCLQKQSFESCICKTSVIFTQMLHPEVMYVYKNDELYTKFNLAYSFLECWINFYYIIENNKNKSTCSGNKYSPYDL